MYSNCLLWALWQWCRKGGALWVEKSQYGWWPHFAWSPDGLRYLCFVPLAPKRRRWSAPVIFRGGVKAGKH